MGKELRCKAEMRAVNEFGELVANIHCEYKVGGKGLCALEDLASRGYKVIPKSTPCLRGYPGNFPKLPSEN